MHFRSDAVAGREFGTVIAARLMQNPGFKAETDAARAELRAVRHINRRLFRRQLEQLAIVAEDINRAFRSDADIADARVLIHQERLFAHHPVAG